MDCTSVLSYPLANEAGKPNFHCMGGGGGGERTDTKRYRKFKPLQVYSIQIYVSTEAWILLCHWDVTRAGHFRLG